MSAIPALVFLHANLDDLAHMPYAEQAWDELDHVTTALERLVDRKAAAVFAGTCDVCGRDLYATPGSDEVTCRPCAITYQASTKRLEMLDALNDRLARASEVIRILPSLGIVVSRKDVDRWVASHRLFAHGSDERGRPLYRVSEVRTLAENTTRRATTRAGG